LQTRHYKFIWHKTEAFLTDLEWSSHPTRFKICFKYPISGCTGTETELFILMACIWRKWRWHNWLLAMRDHEQDFVHILGRAHLENCNEKSSQGHTQNLIILVEGGMWKSVNKNWTFYDSQQIILTYILAPLSWDPLPLTEFHQKENTVCIPNIPKM
jgi:hypothetical protein